MADPTITIKVRMRWKWWALPALRFLEFLVRVGYRVPGEWVMAVCNRGIVVEASP